MFEYTKAAVKKTIADLKKTVYIINVLTQFLTLAYLIYACFKGDGLQIANVVLAVLTAAYFLFFLCATGFGKAPDGKKELKKAVRLVFTWCKRLIKLYTLGVTLYGLYATTQRLSVISLILTALMLVGWLLGVVFDILTYVITKRVKLFLEGLEADVETIKQPIRSVGNFFKKITGKEVEAEKPLTKNQQLLKAMVEEEKQRKQEEKEEKKAKKLWKSKRKNAPLALPQAEIAPTDGSKKE